MGGETRTKLRNTLNTIAGLALALASVSSGAVAQDAAAGDAERKQPRYLREAVERPATREAPDAGEIPETLQLTVETAPAAVEPMRGRDPHGEDEHDLAGEAVRAADWAAEEMARTRGWPQYYRVGFHRGIHVALADDALGSWDYMEGVRFGRSDPEARALGIDLGRSAADEAAADPAAAQVAGQFRDLSREPRFEPRPTAPAWSPMGNWAAAPVESEVFVAYPIARTLRLERRAAEALSGWEWDARRLYECRSYGEFYDARWSDVGLAFERWKDGERRSAFYRRELSREDRERFQAIFASEYRRRLPAYYEGYLRGAYREGFRDGWRYGALANQEWHYRRGYTVGFDEVSRPRPPPASRRPTRTPSSEATARSSPSGPRTPCRASWRCGSTTPMPTASSSPARKSWWTTSSPTTAAAKGRSRSRSRGTRSTVPARSSPTWRQGARSARTSPRACASIP